MRHYIHVYIHVHVYVCIHGNKLRTCNVPDSDGADVLNELQCECCACNYRMSELIWEQVRRDHRLRAIL